MTDGDRKCKRPIICLSSSSSSSEENESESEPEGDDTDSLDEEQVISDVDEADNRFDDSDDNTDDGGCGSGDDSEKNLCNRVISLLREGDDIEGLHLRECKAYLRRHGLRLAGTRAVCIQRILEHWRLQDQNVEALYPRSSFCINCTGDVCKGDVVLFKQKVHMKFGKLRRHGMRTVAGRVVKESYGSTKQQHTFTVEVLWSAGVRRLHTLFPLLVKGRNLYKLKTFRQHWNNEVDRQKVLAEKHQRGAAARHVREMRKSKKFCANGGVNNWKRFHHARPFQMRTTAEPKKSKYAEGHRKDTLQQQPKRNNCHLEAPSLRQLTFKRNVRPEGFKSSWRHRKVAYPTVDERSSHQSCSYAPQHLYILPISSRSWNAPCNFGYEIGSTAAATRLPLLRPYADSTMMPLVHSQKLNYYNETYSDISNPSHNFEARNMNSFPQLIRPSHQFPRWMEPHGYRAKGFQGHHQ